jgi:hypothetical protein
MTQNDILERAIALLTENLNSYDDSYTMDRSYWVDTSIRYYDRERGRMDVILYTDDEGGPSELAIFFTPIISTYVEDPEIELMIHTFDTMHRCLRYRTDTDFVDRAHRIDEG